MVATFDDKQTHLFNKPTVEVWDEHDQVIHGTPYMMQYLYGRQMTYTDGRIKIVQSSHYPFTQSFGRYPERPMPTFQKPPLLRRDSAQMMEAFLNNL